ncbi:MAG: aminotransferase class I/II-fold pyridoxal phosphate-dependent enzyme, partial [Steroidobacteraceae bacterium]
LGLAAHPALIEAAKDCMSRLGFGAAASHLVTGHSLEHHALEEELAAFTGRERALLFSSGYLANVGVVSALAQRHDLILADRLCHASLLDGARLAGAQLRRFAHVDVGAAERLLQRHRERTAAADGALILTDGLFSMDGDVGPVRALADLAGRHDAVLVVDDAHGLGVLGANGRGTLEQAGLSARMAPILIGTLGKAFGSFGAFVAGDAVIIEHLLQHVRTYIYTTALPSAVAAATRAALRLAACEGWRRERLQALVRRWREAAGALGLPLSESRSPIQPLIVGDAARAVGLSAALMNAGFWVAAIRAPTVPAGSARLRITLSAAHRDSDIDALADTLGRLWRERSAA